MMYTMENQILQVKVDTFGAELASIFHKPLQREYLWQGDPEVWKHRSPLLFPYCGPLKNDRFRLEGREYTGGRHGFARDMEHLMETQTSQLLSFQLPSSPQTKEKYPYDFMLETSYALVEEKLICRMQVTNTDTRPIYFALGFHTGINCPFIPGTSCREYILSFQKEENFDNCRGGSGETYSGEFETIHPVGGVIQMNMAGLPKTYVLKAPQSEYTQLTERASGDYVRVYHARTPYLVLWSAPENGAKLICIEPWQGIGDLEHTNGDFTTKNGIVCLPPNKNCQFSQVLEFGRGSQS